MPERGAPQDATVGELAVQLTEHTSRLVHDEVELAKAELRESARHAGVGAGLFGATGLLAVLGLGALVAAAVAALALVLDVWLAALVVAVILFAIAGVGALLGLAQIKEVGPPSTAENVKKDLAAAKGEHA
ncbi:phage holin family protein [Aeromicrobium sp.]|uniref:phage holin family protein n=1 Tax=Aeromicrobium sp. TaxID=1871063 RepID=UPI0025BB14D5|nr:phage holin family protein [Aeromicrobium sp.]MCK5891848.1 phage holin family protein [Aeromicrobium sp.]